MKIQYRKFEGPTMIAIGGGAKNCGQKNQTVVFNFFGAIFITHRGSCDDCDGWDNVWVVG